MNEKTHYRKAFNSPYLSSADIVEPMCFTVSHAKIEKEKARGKEELITIYFTEKEIRSGEKLKPMICNVTNSKAMTKLTGSPYLDDWSGAYIRVFVDHEVRYGKETVEGLRIDPKPPVKVEMATEDQMKKITQFSLDKKLNKAQESYIASHDLSHADADRLITMIERKNNVA